MQFKFPMSFSSSVKNMLLFPLDFYYILIINNIHNIKIAGYNYRVQCCFSGCTYISPTYVDFQQKNSI